MRRREFMAGLGAAAGDAVFQRDQVYGQGSSAVAHRMVEANGIHLHIAEQGEGPLVVLCHGFPESWYSWRHQLTALSAAGFHAVAPDMRGYGRSDRPEAIDQYTLLHLVGDMVGLLDALGAEQAVIAGHDLGAPVAWHAALLRPDRFRAVIGLSVPFRPRDHRLFGAERIKESHHIADEMQQGVLVDRLRSVGPTVTARGATA
jgi:pimeloyl-ACP methyl ester carboxylesterase